MQRFSLIAALALGGLLACSTPTSAQTTNAPARAGRRLTVEQRVDRMATELKLTDDQKAKVTALLETEAKKRQELRADSSLSREDRRQKTRALTQEQTKQLKAILTPDQFEKWQKIRPQRRSRQPETGPAAKKSE